MGKKDPRVDAYIEKAAPFARPILKRLRKYVHENCPECAETLKWSMPYFEYKGRMLCGMSAFKAHCAFGFWHPLMRPSDKSPEGMGQFGRIASVADLPSEGEFAQLVQRAMKLADEGVKAPPRPKKERAPIVVPPELGAALAKNKRAHAAFQGFSYSHRKEYVEWIAEAKREETRKARIAQAVEWMAEGKSRHWKYAK
jgi:uncharacterized protein YdeI (YjbR/CyaY-like superfamily)